MYDEKVLDLIKKFNKELPKFSDSRIDYSNSNIAPIINVFVKFKDEILILKRSDKVLHYRGKWYSVAGYLDELKPIKEKILEELREELGIGEEMISLIHIGKFYEFKDEKINQTWLIHPILVELKEKPTIKLDMEHIEFKWIKPEELKNFDIVKNLDKSLTYVL
jgi:isopentenyldiphosphate isomerase